MIRKIVHIDESKCDGCGQCIPSCAEGAIALVNGKARLSGDALCDGLGACLGECPQGAITVVERDADAFDEAVVAAHLARQGRAPAADHAAKAPAPPAAAPARPRPLLSVVPSGDPAPQGGGCPGSRARTLPPRGRPLAAAASGDAATPASGESRLTHWPVQLHLVPVGAPWLDGADLLVAADCVPFACARFHDDLLAGHALVVGCPKLDDNRFYAEKLGQMLARSDVRSVTVARMEVPCCGGISMAARQAIAASGKAIPLRDVVVGVDGALHG
ncbi:4Fe-4S ferredoxin iron-sulfur binding domain protein [Anaeromyxobacter sp. K]|uniref:ATP-binding protein n=1 Tax=Anaeromyxobacter sp. (strain K) TaxID=447217 RepID=UPI00015F92D6|nr:4Fe-4S binding protein [Anaeromyxobacter sp. K]ACG75409.1 4Fe-4S ferredoxin iron-sulfur binding domain protein [Anaeromyxobacter sp. K]